MRPEKKFFKLFIVNDNHMEHMKLFLNGCGTTLDTDILFKELFLFLADSFIYFPRY